MSSTDDYTLNQTAYGQGIGQGDAGESQDRYRVDYKNRSGRVLSYLMTFTMAVMGGYAVLHYGLLEQMMSGAEAKKFIYVGGFVLALFLFDIMWLMYAMMSGKPAIAMDEKGVRGFHGGLWRNMVWDDVGYIYYRIGQLIVVRRPRSKLMKALHHYSLPGGRSRPEHCIVVPLKHVDVNEEEMLAQIARFSPEASEKVMSMAQTFTLDRSKRPG